MSFEFFKGKLARRYALAIVALTSVLILLAGVAQSFLAFQASYRYAQVSGQNITDLIERELASQLGRVQDLLASVTESRMLAVIVKQVDAKDKRLWS